MYRKIVYIFLIILIFSKCLHSKNQTISNSLPFSIQKSTLQATTIIFKLPEYFIDQVEVNGIIENEVRSLNANNCIQAGKPKFPFYSTTIAIPRNSNPKLNSLQVKDSQNYSNIKIKTIENDNESIISNERIYETKGVQTAESITISEVQVFRDYNIININYYPFSYSSTKRELTINKSVEITIEHEPISGEGFQNHIEISKVFEPMYKALIANYDQIKSDYPVYQKPRLLIIYPNVSNTQFQTSLSGLINWKKQKGFQVNAVSTTMTGNSSTLIKSYIQNLYNNIETRPDYILLIGDAGLSDIIIPTFSESYQSSLPSGEGDYPYTFLEGNDKVGDAIIGRISVDNGSTFSVIVSKILSYEKTPDLAGTDWLNNALLVSDSNQSGISTIQVNQYVESLIEDFDSSHNYNRVYGNVNSNQMVNGMNQGVFYFNYRGFYGTSGFNNGSLAELTNVSKLPLCVFLTCDTGAFMGTSLIESISRLGTSTNSKGAIASIGLSTSHTLTPYNNFMSCGIAEAFFGKNIPEIGSAMLYSKVKLLKTYNGDLLNHSNTLNQWMNLMGDPSIQLYRTIPKGFSVTVPSSVFIGSHQISITVKDQEGSPISDALVSLFYNGIANPITDYSNSQGDVLLPVNQVISDNIIITISKADFKTYIVSIPTISGATIGVESSSILDSPNGNNNQQINPGETIKLSTIIKNFTSSAKNDLTVNISTDNPYIEITDSTGIIPIINSESTANLTDEFTFSVSSVYPANMPLNMKVTIRTGNEVYEDYLFYEVKVIDIDFQAYEVLTPSQILNIGETASIKVLLKNNGQISSGQLSIKLKSKSMFLQVVDSMSVVSSIDPGESITNQADPFIIHSLNGIYPGVRLPLTMEISNSQGYQEEEVFDIQVGQVGEHDPIPPDSYGYVCYDQTDTDYSDAPIYDWIEIANIGTQLDITDVGNNGDQTVQVQLPFSFRMYGKGYTQLSICSNGWLSPGFCDQTTFRNVGIPGPMVPRPLIAPYWNDLALSGISSRVMTWYDPDNHYFIVQWNDLKCVQTVMSVDQSANVTFQVILYDPEYYATSLGDSPIKFQYLSFHPGYNNDDLERPNNYFTTGIMDETGSRGIQYVYNNIYSPGATPLNNSSALYFTHPYFLNENPYLTLNSPILQDENGNQIFEAGETVRIGVPLLNIGLTNATNVHASLSSSDPWITILHGNSDYENLVPSGIESNVQDFIIKISNNCTNNLTATMKVHISTNEGEWDRSFNFLIRKALLGYSSYLINDESGNGNGLLDTGENAKIIVNIVNQSEIDIRNLQVHLTSENSQLNIVSNPITIPIMQGNSMYQAVFNIQVSSQISDQLTLPIQLELTSSNADPLNKVINVGINQNGALLEESFNDWLPQGWIVQYYSNNWVQANTNLAGGTAPEVVFYGIPSFTGLTRFISKTLDATLYSSVMLSFKHTLVLNNESEASIGVATRTMYGEWHTVWSMPISGVTGETRNIPINNSDIGHPNFQICWFIDGATNGISSWNLDDAELQASIGNTALIKGMVSLDSNLINIQEMKVTSGDYSTIPNTEGNYELYVLPGNYQDICVQHSYIHSNQLPGMSLITGQILENQNLFGNYIAPINTLTYNYSTTSHQIIMNWLHDLPTESPLILSGFKVYRQINNGQYDIFQNSNTNTCSDQLDPHKTYRYYITANYGNFESDSSNVITILSEGVDNEDNLEKPIINCLNQNYPNPFNPCTKVSFSISERLPVKVSIYNIKGQCVRTLLNERLEKGRYDVVWSGDNDQGRRVSSGIYFVQMHTPKYTNIKKALLLK